MTSSIGKPLFLLLSTLVLAGCGAGDTNSDDFEFIVPDVSAENVIDDIFDRDRLIQVAVKMPSADFAQMRGEGRTLDSVMSNCPDTDFEYTDFKATVYIDGEELENVAIRKKGYLGSLSPSRPSIKLNFDTHEDGRTFKTMKRMTLNNDRQDASHTHQCMAYDLYRAAGLVAPRCNLANVMINGEDMGVYSHIESIKKPFLERNYQDKSGNLYEAQIADFGTELNNKFERKTNKSDLDRSDLTAISDLLQNTDITDENFVLALGELIDLEEFIKFWAVETLIGHWDSATGNNNNFYIYRDPTDGLFHFIPWGTDSAFTSVNPFKPGVGPLYHNLSISSRLFAIADTKVRYFNAINALLSDQWNENGLLETLDKIQNLTSAPDSAYAHMETFISGDDETLNQRDYLATAMAGDVPQNEYLLEDKVEICDNPKATTGLTASFESTTDDDGFGSFTFVDHNGETITASLDSASATSESLLYALDETSEPGVVNLSLVGSAGLFEYYVLQVFIEKPNYKAGDHDLHGIVNNMMLFKVSNVFTQSLALISAGHSGTINLQSAGDGTNSKIQGSIDVQMGYLDAAQ